MKYILALKSVNKLNDLSTRREGAQEGKLVMDNPMILTIYDKLALDTELASTGVTIVPCNQVVMTGCLLVLGVGTRGGGRRMAPCYPGR